MRMRATAHLVLLCMAGGALATPTVTRLAWTVETSEPKQRRLELRHGETVDIEVRLQSYQAAMDISGASVVLHARTNGMPAGTSFQVVGEAHAAGVAAVRVPVSAWLPHDLTVGTYTLAVTQTNSAAILRAEGPLCVTQTAAASTNDPVPVVWLDDIRTEIAAAVAIGAPVQSVNGKTGAVVLSAVDVGAVASEQDLAALRVWHYGSPNIVENSEIRLDLYDGVVEVHLHWQHLKHTFTGVYVLPWCVDSCCEFSLCSEFFAGSPVSCVYVPRGVTNIENRAFECCQNLTNVFFAGSCPAFGWNVFKDCHPDLTITVLNPHALWPPEVQGVPVIRPSLHASNLYQGGDRVATENYVSESVANIAAPSILREGVRYRQFWDTNLNTTAWEPVP